MSCVSGLARRALALALLILLAPLLALLALALVLTQGRPVLFRQWRAGLMGAPFPLYKFRSMRAPRFDGEPDAARLTRLGRWLRRSSLDELPGLWNVVRGEMNFIGPRPLLLDYLPRYSPEQARRHLLRPGMTGWAQVHGRNALDWPARLRLDVWYVDHASWRLDLLILWRTLGIVLGGAGIGSPGQPTGEEFRGSDGGKS
ncbi:sugar transferase [Bordetella pseudohinzii]|uniref:Putative colanic biosynthesis UDP-glucose lipid carrier transferase n=1 Tax=Bordetella pseudohinzii TaxID=1331258 RepID=A0A0M7I192_9BORD|nr:sugar transferase [Bordetella pseudohinzii]CUJ15840.1 Putative colanic biosynthesis UDP-glucose lipid carrier transferase [Bordetella pseudohinzii]